MPVSIVDTMLRLAAFDLVHTPSLNYAWVKFKNTEDRIRGDSGVRIYFKRLVPTGLRFIGYKMLPRYECAKSDES